MTAPEQASPWLTREQVAARLQMQPDTLKWWAVKGKGPRFAKFGRHVRYRISDIIAWEEQQVTGGES